MAEAALWLGLVPLLAYWLTFWPAFHWTKLPVDPFDPVGWHQYMLQLQDSVVKPHPYRSEWWQWVINQRAIWYLYEVVDGAQRGIVLIGNPFTMLAGLPALDLDNGAVSGVVAIRLSLDGFVAQLRQVRIFDEQPVWLFTPGPASVM